MPYRRIYIWRTFRIENKAVILKFLLGSNEWLYNLTSSLINSLIVSNFIKKIEAFFICAQIYYYFFGVDGVNCMAGAL